MVYIGFFRILRKGLFLCNNSRVVMSGTQNICTYIIYSYICSMVTGPASRVMTEFEELYFLLALLIEFIANVNDAEL